MEVHAWLTTLILNLYLINNMEHIVYFTDWQWHNFSSKSHFYTETTIKNYRFLKRIRGYLINSW